MRRCDKSIVILDHLVQSFRYFLLGQIREWTRAYPVVDNDGAGTELGDFDIELFFGAVSAQEDVQDLGLQFRGQLGKHVGVLVGQFIIPVAVDDAELAIQDVGYCKLNKT